MTSSDSLVSLKAPFQDGFITLLSHLNYKDAYTTVLALPEHLPWSPETSVKPS